MSPNQILTLSRNKLRKLFIRPFDLLPLEGVGAEIGVSDGVHAALLLKRKKAITKLHLVDPYLEYEQEPNRAKSMIVAHKRMKKFGNRAMFHRCKIDEANLPTLNFIYIDGNHDYENVSRDIKRAVELVKQGGIVGGHDFHHTWPGVIKAVTEYTVKHNINLCVETPDWWFIAT